MKLNRPRAQDRRIPIGIDIACNDPDNGHFAGRAEFIQFPSLCLELCARHRPAPKLVELEEDFEIRLAGKRWPILQCRFGVGNWCWNRYWMTDDIATAFLQWLKGRRLFSTESGWQQLYDWWNDPASPMDAAFLTKILRDAAAQHRS